MGEGINTLLIGRQGEEAAREHLRRLGHEIMELNWRSGHHEIDIISRAPDHSIHFVEVKTRHYGSLTTPAEAITRAKIRHLVSAANHYVELHEVQSEVWIDLASVISHPDGHMDVELVPDISNLRW